jgi:hypothetical protein
MKDLRESIEDLVGTERLPSPALQSAYNKGFYDARSAAAEIVADAERHAVARAPESEAFSHALTVAIVATLAGLGLGFIGVSVLKLHILWLVGFAGLGAAVGVGVAAWLLRRG